MKIAVGADHGGFLLKGAVVFLLKDLDCEVVDLGAFAETPGDDYPDFARAVSEAVRGGTAERGIVICGSGVGASIAASKFPGVRAAVCHDTYSAHQGVEHDDMNVLCLGARIIGIEAAKEIVAAFVRACFSGEVRHRRRVEKVKAIEGEFLKP